MDYFMQQVLNAIAWGSIIALLGAGYTMTFGILGLVNFAHGEVAMVAGFVAHFIITVYKLPFWLGVLLGLVGAIIVGLVIERVAFKPVRGAGMITLFITSLGASVVVRNLTIMVFNDKLKNFIFPDFLKGAYLLGDLIIFKKMVGIFLITIGVCIMLVYFVKKTKMGIAMRSISYDKQMAESLGVNTEKVIVIVFIIASALAGLAGLLWGILFGSVQASIGFLCVVPAFIASVIGGIGNVFGAVVAGYILGIGGALFIAYLPLDLVGLRPSFIWILFFILLIVKPSGLFRANIK